MEKQQIILASFFSVIIILGLVSFTLCVAAEFKRSKKEDLRFDGKLCYLPKSVAFGLGSTALIFLFIAQIIGSLLICRDFLSGDKESSCKNKKPTIIASIVLTISWISFGVAAILQSVATSMNRSQKFGEGWLDGECYIVKDGVYIGSGIMVLITLSFTLSSAIITIRKRQVEQGRRVHAQVEISFGVAAILQSVATSMNRSQKFGEGWLDGECYIVKDGVYIGSGIMVLITLSFTLSSAIITMRKRQVEQGRRVHAQVE